MCHSTMTVQLFPLVTYIWIVQLEHMKGTLRCPPLHAQLPSFNSCQLKNAWWTKSFPRWSFWKSINYLSIRIHLSAPLRYTCINSTAISNTVSILMYIWCVFIDAYKLVCLVRADVVDNSVPCRLSYFNSVWFTIVYYILMYFRKYMICYPSYVPWYS